MAIRPDYGRILPREHRRAFILAIALFAFVLAIVALILVHHVLTDDGYRAPSAFVTSEAEGFL